MSNAKRRHRRRRRVAAHVRKWLLECIAVHAGRKATCLLCSRVFHYHELTNRYGSYTCLPCTEVFRRELVS